MRYVLHYDVAALILTFIILIHFHHKKSIRSSQTYVFVGLIWTLLLSDILDVVSVFVDDLRIPLAVAYAVNVVYLIAFNLLPFLCYLYLLTISDRNDRNWNVPKKIMVFGPVSAVVVLILTTPLTKWVFEYDQTRYYEHGLGFIVICILSGTYVIASLVRTVRSKSTLTGWQRIAVYFYLTAACMGAIIQIIFPDVLIMQFVAALTVLLLYMSLENPEDDEEKYLGIYNRSGFDKMIANAVGKQDAFHVIVVTITNFPSIREALGAEFSRILTKQVVSNLKVDLKPLELFYLSEGKLAVIVDEKSENLNRTVAAIREELGEPVVTGGMNLQLETVMIQLDYPNDVKTVEDIMDSIDYSSTMPYESDDGEILRAGGEILARRRRESKILQIMKNALVNGTFQVYYQPIYSNRQGKFNSAEALIRLYDKELGFISPDEFIPMAEKNGMILKIGEFVFRTVCRMMANERIWEKGIDYIEINLSVVQCMQEDICEMLYGIMDEYDVPYSCINLEVTETTIARDVLWDTMERMIVGGVTFSLDDYGTGYSNLSNVLKYPFHIVKLDKSMVWFAMENEAAMRALRHTVAMLQDLNMSIVAEGVETEEQSDILREMGCEYLQGYYFSKPVPEDEFLEKMKIA